MDFESVNLSSSLSEIFYPLSSSRIMVLCCFAIAVTQVRFLAGAIYLDLVLTAINYYYMKIKNTYSIVTEYHFDPVTKVRFLRH